MNILYFFYEHFYIAAAEYFRNNLDGDNLK